MKYTLYGFKRSSATWRVKNVLAYKGISFNNIEINLIKSENKTDEFQKINPAMRVPLLHITEEDGS